MIRITRKRSPPPGGVRAGRRKDNPSTFHYASYGPRPQEALADEIDWDRFKQVRPKEYAKIKAQIQRLGVTWQQAVNDWEVRYEILARRDIGIQPQENHQMKRQNAAYSRPPQLHGACHGYWKYRSGYEFMRRTTA